MRIDLAGRRALVTGAAQGIGSAIAVVLGNAGAEVQLADIDAEGVETAGKRIGVPVHAVDLANRDAATALAWTTRPDILALAAGGVCGQTGAPLEEIGEADWKEIFAANLESALWLVQAAVPAMKSRGWGRIVAVASGAGLRPSLTGLHAYTAAKHALVGLIRQLAQELGPYGIAVNAIAPGFIRSNPATERQWAALGHEGQAQLIESIHMRRLGTPDDIAGVAAFLASDQAGWISGQVLGVDGGRA